MADLGYSSTPDMAADAPDFGLIPNGWLHFIIEGAEFKANRKGGRRLSCTFVVRRGQPHAGRRIWQSYNVDLPHSPEAERIGRGELSRLHTAAGLEKLTDTEQLLGLAFMGKVGVERSRNPDYDDRNKIVDYKPARSGSEDEFGAPPRSDVPPPTDDDLDDIPF